MANPFSHGGGGNNMMLPLMMLSMMHQAPQGPAQAPMQPQGSPYLFVNPSGQGTFAGGAAAIPTSNQLGGKSLLGG